MPDKKQPRMTFKTQYGDYGISPQYEKLNEYTLIQMLANRLGRYEDADEAKEVKINELCK